MLDLLFIESLEDYVILHTVNSKEIVYTTLKQIYQDLPKEIFLQTHQSYIVNINCVRTIDDNQLSIDSHRIPIARNLIERDLARLLF